MPIWLRSDLNYLSTSSYVAFRNLKLFGLFVNESMRYSMTFAFFPTTLSADLLKNSFSADGSVRSVFMLGLRMRYMAFGFPYYFEDKIFP